MAITKPSWLRSWLDKLNWDIFTWKVYIGDAIEVAIDWVIDWINEAITWGIDAWNKAVAAWDKAVEVGKQAWANLVKEATQIWNRIETWWDELGEWWEAKKAWIRDLVDTAEGWLLDRIKDVQKGLDKLGEAWDNFVTITLPSLASHFDIAKAFDDFRLQWYSLFNFWGAFGKGVIEFFLNPLDWIANRLEDWFWGPEKK